MLESNFDETIVLNDLFLDLIDSTSFDYKNDSLLKHPNKIVLLKTYLVLDDDFTKQVNSLVNEGVLNESQVQLVKSLSKYEKEGESNFDNKKLIDIGSFMVIDSLDNKHKSDILGVLSLSRINYNEAENVGCFYYEFLCSKTCGHKSLVIFKKGDKKWEIYKEFVLWVS
jgi:hypothetical protein